jgi:hypothetical protein
MIYQIKYRYNKLKLYQINNQYANIINKLSQMRPPTILILYLNNT